MFVHAGLLPEHVRGTPAAGEGEGAEANAEEVMENLNAAACSWMLGERAIPEEMWGIDSPLWTRVYSDPDSRDVGEAARARLEDVSVPVGARRVCGA